MMKNFLEFLNTASPVELSNLTGITPGQVDKIVAERPFASLEDCAYSLELTGDGFSKLKADYELAAAAEIESAEKQEQEPQPEPEKTAVKRSTASVILRVVLALLLLAALFLLFYFGIPLFKEKILNPLQSNTARVSEVASLQAADVERLSDEITALQERITTLEGRADAVDESLASHSETLVKLEEMQVSLQASLDAHKTDVLKQIDEQLTLTRAIELLARSRLYLSQSNFGLAKADIAAARDLLFGLQPTIAADQSAALKIIIERLDLALSNLPVYPVVAVYDLDLAWQYLVDGLPNVPQTAVTPVISETQLPAEITPETQVTPTPGG
jgi:cell division protein FtsB